MRSFLPAAALLMLIPAGAQAQSVATAPIAGTRLEISARGEVKRVPDIATISAGVVTQAVDARTALSDNSARMTRVVAALRKAGVAERDLSTAQISLSPQYRYADNQPPVITGYQASNSVSVRFRDISASGAILDALVAQGANQINGPALSIDKPEAALDEARLSAMAAARSRAALYARAAGLTVRRIVAISESADEQSRPYPVMMRAMSADAAAKTEVLPGEQSVGVTVAVTFELG
ncbi:SIMPL domain-containing protein [Sphingomonas antarctica]|uniref:SIMPL domain-containing protein n=1 Tax=Sphingomonas antarctica TaxID=2040274 RepID=UPI0039EA512F